MRDGILQNYRPQIENEYEVAIKICRGVAIETSKDFKIRCCTTRCHKIKIQLYTQVDTAYLTYPCLWVVLIITLQELQSQ